MDSTNEDSSILEHNFCLEGFGSYAEEVCLSMKFSRNFTCSIIGLCVKQPLVVISRHRLASIPKQKSCSNMLSGKDKFGPACINAKNLAQAAPIDSFLRCSKLRIALGRESIWDIGKNAR